MKTTISAPKRITNPAPGLPVRASRRITEAQKQAFVDALAQCGNFAEASRRVSHWTETGGAKTYRRAMDNDAGFKLAVESAMDQFDAALWTEATHRALTGDLVPIVQKGSQAVMHDGSPAWLRKKSDAILLKLLAARFPAEFAEQKRVEIQHNSGNRGGDGLYIGADELVWLSPHDKTALKGILQTLARARRETEIELTAIDITPESEREEPEDWELAQ